MRPGSKLGAMLDQESAADRGEIVRAQDWRVEESDAEEEKSHTDKLADELAKKAEEQHEEEAPPPPPEPEFDA
jgi:hypothetical protein